MKHRKSLFWLKNLGLGILSFFVFCNGQGRAAVKLNGLFCEHMVSEAGEKVTVEFAGQSKTAEADAAGRWRVTLDPLAVQATPGVLTARGSDTVTVSDVVVGDVWLASGQSNMGFSLSGASNAAEVLPQAKDELLRFFEVKKATAAEPQTAVSGGKWETTSPDTAKGFSAVAYFFAREIRAKKGCPVGVIAGAWGGTPIQIWISLAGLKKEPALTRALDQWDKAEAAHAQCEANPQLVTDYAAALKQWQAEVQPGFDAVMKQYNEDKAAGKPVGAKPQPSQPEPQNPDPMGMTSPSKRPHTPTVAFNAMIAPLIPYALRGAIWYQGEENGGAGMEYRDLFPRLIEDWRGHWGYDFPFLYVQLPCNGPDTAPVATAGWPWLREAQLMTLREPKTGMAITIDIGDPANVHPQDKIDVGQRLALLERKIVEGETLEASGPLFRDFSVSGNEATVRFTETGGGLTPGQAPWRPAGVEPLPTDKVIGFFVAGEDEKWFPAEARIAGDAVVVSSPEVAKPVAVRYGWANSPRCNLYNKEGLPASPFRTDDWGNPKPPAVPKA
jgi:sialate O-acetylesterase